MNAILICLAHTNICIYRHRKKVLDMEKNYDKIKCYTTELGKNLKSSILWGTEYEDKYTILLKIIFTL